MTAQRLEPGHTPNLTVAFAKSAFEVREAQRLRYHVFAGECGAHLESATLGIDEDEFDSSCEYLIVRDHDTDQVVGTYRILTSWKAKELGWFYSESEFDLARLRPLLPRIVEVGRSCIHQDYRRGGVMTLLWAGLARFMLTGGYEYLMGCASMSLADGGNSAAETYLSLRGTHLSQAYWRVVPHRPFPIPSGVVVGTPILPPLIKGYVRLGAYTFGKSFSTTRIARSELRSVNACKTSCN